MKRTGFRALSVLLGVLLLAAAGVPHAMAADGGNMTALAQAAAAGRTAAVDALLARGADPNARQPGGRTALMLAAQAGHYETVRLLLIRGAVKELRDDDGRSALELATERRHGDIIALMQEGS